MAQSNVNDAATSTLLLASNSERRGAAIWNDSTAVLYVLLGSDTASATVASAKIAADGYYETPPTYTGAITGIWASDASGAARITEW
jgi:hypothetical protein